MEEITKEKNKEVELDLQRILGMLLSKAWLVALVAVVCAVVAFVGTVLFITPKYTSSVMFYVNNSSISLEDIGITNSDISASRGLVKSYITILNTRETMNQVIDYAEVDRTYGQILGMISADAVNSTEIFRVSVTSPDRYEAEEIAKAIAYVLPKRIESIITGTSSKVVDMPIVPGGPSSPNYTLNTVIGFLVGLFATVVILVVVQIFDVTIRTEEDIANASKYPVLTTVPDMEYHGKNGYYRHGGAYSKAASDSTQTILLGKGINFAASEAYKVLRTKLQFSFADEMQCHIIGISSAMTGEGKSLTAVNLAYSMSQLGKRVLLIDCDMRRPSIADKLPVQQSPGLSDFLSGQVRGNNLIKLCGLEEDESAFHVIPAGRIPPNPMELLSSARMEKTLNNLRENYDYILLDLPPVGEVGDALAVAKLTDGLLVVVRQDHCNRVALAAAIRQFEFVNTKIVGITYNCAKETNKHYRKHYYKKYGKKYYKSYRYYRPKSTEESE